MIPLGVMGSAHQSNGPAGPPVAVFRDGQMAEAATSPTFTMNLGETATERTLIVFVTAVGGSLMSIDQCTFHGVVLADLDYHSPVGLQSSAAFRVTMETGTSAQVNITLSTMCDSITVALWSVPGPVVFDSGQYGHDTVNTGPTPAVGFTLGQTLLEGSFQTFTWADPMVEAQQMNPGAFLSSQAACGTNGPPVDVSVWTDLQTVDLSAVTYEWAGQAQA